MPTGRYEKTEEHKRKLSEACKGNKHSEETKRKIGLASKGKNLGKHPTEETREKMRLSHIGNQSALGCHWKHSEETKKRMSEVHTGFKHTDEAKKKIGNLKRGDKCPFWQGGISNDPYPQGWTEVLKESIRQRDDFICQECGIHQDELAGRFKKLDVHHIDYNKNNLNPDNLIALCRSCHIKTNSNREYWIEHFKDDTNFNN